MIPRHDMDTDYDHPDVLLPWSHLAASAAWGLLLLVALAPVCGAALLATRLRALARRALGQSPVHRPTLEELAGRGSRRL